jgi:hypothetical protein
MHFTVLLSTLQAGEKLVDLQEFKATLAGLRIALDTASSQSSGPNSLTGKAHAKIASQSVICFFQHNGDH